MFNTKSKFHKGSSVLVSALVTAAASTLIGYGLTKMISTGIDAIKNQEVKMQGQQYAASRINVLRSVRFDSLSPMAKRQINDTDYYEEVVESDSTADRKNYAVNIYKGSDSVKPVAVMNLSRTATGALLDNQGADSYDSLGAGGNADSSALNTSALKNYTNDKFSADSESFATDRAMDVKSFVSYVDGLLSKYRFRNNAVTVGPNGAGSRRNPIYVTAAERECTAGSVTYAMSGNSQGYLATVTPAGNGLYYVDYAEKDVPDETTGGATGGTTGGGTNINGSENLPQETQWIFDKLIYWDMPNYKDFKETIQIKIPDGVKVLCLEGDTCVDMYYHDGKAESINIVMNGSKEWLNLRSYYESYCGDIFADISQDYKIVYIGVIPGKTYYLNINLKTRLNNDTTYNVGVSNSSLRIGYSKSINEKVPDIIDY